MNRAVTTLAVKIRHRGFPADTVVSKSRRHTRRRFTVFHIIVTAAASSSAFVPGMNGEKGISSHQQALGLLLEFCSDEHILSDGYGWGGEFRDCHWCLLVWSSNFHDPNHLSLVCVLPHEYQELKAMRQKLMISPSAFTAQSTEREYLWESFIGPTWYFCTGEKHTARST